MDRTLASGFGTRAPGRPVVDGLIVTAYALTSSGSLSTAVSPVGAFPNPRGVYVFHSIPYVDRAPGRRRLEAAPSSSWCEIDWRAFSRLRSRRPIR